MARTIEGDGDIDRDEDELPESLEAILAAALKTGDDDSADDEGDSIFSEPLKEAKEIATVSIEDGLDLIDKADQKRRRAVKAGDEPEAVAEDAPAEAAKAEAEPEPEAAPPAVADVLAGLTEPQRAAVSARIGVADEVATIFTANQTHLAGLGDTPAGAFKRLAEINAYAAQNPGEYLAWAAGQLSGGKAQEALTVAAQSLGFKIVPIQAEEEDDPFEDPEKKELRAEVARLKGQGTPPLLGPDNPARRAATDLQSFQTETNPDGTLKRPLFEQLGVQIAAAAKAHVAQTGQPVTMADLDRLYTEAEASVRAKLGISAAPVTSAAQQNSPVSGVDTKKAASVAKAQAASKSLDGAGPGADRRPAPPEGASIADTMKHFLGQN